MFRQSGYAAILASKDGPGWVRILHSLGYQMRHLHRAFASEGAEQSTAITGALFYPFVRERAVSYGVGGDAQCCYQFGFHFGLVVLLSYVFSVISW